jgi:hypothetical protein
MGYRHMYGYDVPASCASAEKYYKAAAALVRSCRRVAQSLPAVLPTPRRLQVLGELADGKKGTVLENLRLSNEEVCIVPRRAFTL